MRAFLILVAVVVLAGIGWFLFGAGGDAPVTGETTAPAAEAVEEAAEGAAEATEGAAAEATEAASDAVETVTEEVGTAVEEAADAVEETVEGATDTAADAVEGVADSLAGAMTVEGFDAAQIRDAIAASSLDDTQKQAAEALLQSAEQDPALVQSVIDQLKTQLGL